MSEKDEMFIENEPVTEERSYPQSMAISDHSDKWFCLMSKANTTTSKK